MGRALGKALREIEEARLVGIADVDPAALQAAQAELEAPGFASAEALLAQPDLQAVIVASPGFQHRPLTELATAAGKSVFVEKPMATTVADCNAMIAAAERAKVLLMVGQVLRFYPCWWQIIDMVRRGEIGQPLGVTVSRVGGRFGGVWKQSWRNSLSLSGGLLLEVNAHEIDFMCQVAGDVTRVYAEADHYGDEPTDYPNLYFVSLRFASGAVGLLHASSVSALGDLSGKVEGADGAIFYAEGFSGNGEIRWKRQGGEAQTIRIGDIQREPPVRHELRLFVEALRTGAPSPIPGSEGRRNVAIAEASYESARTNRPVTL
jgi:predicted dehydrogenase